MLKGEARKGHFGHPLGTNLGYNEVQETNRRRGPGRRDHGKGPSEGRQLMGKVKTGNKDDLVPTSIKQRAKIEDFQHIKFP